MPLSKARMRERKRQDRGSYLARVCEVCGYSETIDIHHDESRKKHALCPNHHAIVTRKIQTLEELRSNLVARDNVKPSKAKLGALRQLIRAGEGKVDKRPAPRIYTEALKEPELDADGNEIPDLT